MTSLGVPAALGDAASICDHACWMTSSKNGFAAGLVAQDDDALDGDGVDRALALVAGSGVALGEAGQVEHDEVDLAEEDVDRTLPVGAVAEDRPNRVRAVRVAGPDTGRRHVAEDDPTLAERRGGCEPEGGPERLVVGEEHVAERAVSAGFLELATGHRGRGSQEEDVAEFAPRRFEEGAGAWLVVEQAEVGDVDRWLVEHVGLLGDLV